RYLRRPFRYRSQSNRLATLFVLGHARYCPTYAVYQFGHEIKAARYDFFYRVLRWLHVDIEPFVLPDGSYPFDPGIGWLKAILFGIGGARQQPLWHDDAVIEDILRRTAQGECPTALDVARQYSYPLTYVENVLMSKLCYTVQTGPSCQVRT